MSHIKGFTLIEALITVAILVSTTAIAVPSLAEFVVRNRVDNEMYRLFKLLQTARSHAISSGQVTTVCPLNNANVCSEQWHKELTVFIDGNNNQIYEPELAESLLSTKAAIQSDDKLQYGKRRIGVSYSPTGHLASWGHNGTFKYCPNNHLDLARGIIVATSGRIYKTYQTQTGIDKTRRYQRIYCR